MKLKTTKHYYSYRTGKKQTNKELFGQPNIAYSPGGKLYRKQELILKHVLTPDGKPNVFVHDINKHKYICYHTMQLKTAFFCTDAFLKNLFTCNTSGDANKTRLTVLFTNLSIEQRESTF